MCTIATILKHLIHLQTVIAIGFAVCLFLLLRGKQKSGKILLAIILSTYYLLSIESTAYFLSKSLETEIENKVIDKKNGEIEAIVVLSNFAQEKGGYRPYDELSGTAWRRLWHGIELYNKFGGQIPIIYSGHSGNPFDPISVEAQLARNFAISIGVLKNKFWIEPSSYNTYESSIEIKRILDENFPGTKSHRIILVTSALHMPRSLRVMEKQGLSTIPSPADFSKGYQTLNPWSFLPSVEHFRTSGLCIYEWLGILAYKILGRM
jgi:uncharacterized SAM-binding protein YcdF (DUF218 family)